MVARGADGPYLDIIKRMESAKPHQLLVAIDKAKVFFREEKQRNVMFQKNFMGPSNNEKRGEELKKALEVIEEEAKKFIDAEALLQEIIISQEPSLLRYLFFNQSDWPLHGQDVARSSTITSSHLQQDLGEFKTINLGYFHSTEKQQIKYFQALEHYFQQEKISPAIMILSASHASGCFYNGKKWLYMDNNHSPIVRELSTEELVVGMKKAHYYENTSDFFCFRIEFFAFFKNEAHPLSEGIKKINQENDCLTSDSVEKKFGFSFDLFLLFSMLSRLESNGIPDKDVQSICKNKYLLTEFVKIFFQLRMFISPLTQSFINTFLHPPGDNLESILVQLKDYLEFLFVQHTGSMESYLEQCKEIRDKSINNIFDDLMNILSNLRETNSVHGEINMTNIIWNDDTKLLSLCNFPEQTQSIHSEDQQAILAIFHEIMYAFDWVNKEGKPDIRVLPSEARAIYQQLRGEIPSQDVEEDEEVKSTISEQEKSFNEEFDEQTEFDEEDEVTKRIKNA